MENHLKLAAKKLSAFLLPFFLLAAAIVYVDPFEYFSPSKAKTFERKKRVASRINYALWKTIHFQQSPSPNIILGDSRMGPFDENMIAQYSKDKYFNFSYGGGSLPEITSTFWFASKLVRLKRVYIGIDLNLYNGYLGHNRVIGALNILHNPFLYLISRDAWKAIWYLFKIAWLNGDENIEKPPMDHDRFWSYQLTTTSDRYYSLYQYPEKYYAELLRIIDFCKANKIELTFIILPVHQDLEKKIREHYQLNWASERMRVDISSLAKTIDFNYACPLTQSRSNFNDPYHLTHDAADLVAAEIWGQASLYGRRL